MAKAQCPGCGAKIALPKGRLVFHCYSCMAPVKLRSEIIRQLPAHASVCLLLIPLPLLNFESWASWLIALVLALGAGIAAWFWFEGFSLTLDR